MSSDEFSGSGPAGPPFGMTVRHVHGRVVVELTGELDLATAPRLRDRLAQLSEDGEDQVIIDLTRLDFIDSTGLSVLVMAFTRAQSSGGSVVLRNPSTGVMRILEITGLASLFTIAADDEPVPHSGD